MTIDEIKRDISIITYLKIQGINPDKTHNGYVLYKSPFRDEKTASFKVDYNKNLWHDFGTGEGGSIIDLVMKMQQCNFIQAKQFLSNIAFVQSQKTNHQTENNTSFLNTPKNEKLIINEIINLQHPQLLAFLKSRKINTDTAKIICKEIHYQIGGRNYFAVGFPNDAGGYELRNPQFKGCVPPKEITTFDRQTTTVHLFEGFMDYLSLLTLQAKQADVSAVVLNSITNEKRFRFSRNIQKSMRFWIMTKQEKGFGKTEKRNLPVVDISKRYAEYKDVNDYLCGKKIAIQPTTLKNKRLKF